MTGKGVVDLTFRLRRFPVGCDSAGVATSAAGAGGAATRPSEDVRGDSPTSTATTAGVGDILPASELASSSCCPRSKFGLSAAKSPSCCDLRRFLLSDLRLFLIFASVPGEWIELEEYAGEAAGSAGRQYRLNGAEMRRERLRSPEVRGTVATAAAGLVSVAGTADGPATAFEAPVECSWSVEDIGARRSGLDLAGLYFCRAAIRSFVAALGAWGVEAGSAAPASLRRLRLLFAGRSASLSVEEPGGEAATTAGASEDCGGVDLVFVSFPSPSRGMIEASEASEAVFDLRRFLRARLRPAGEGDAPSEWESEEVPANGPEGVAVRKGVLAEDDVDGVDWGSASETRLAVLPGVAAAADLRAEGIGEAAAVAIRAGAGVVGGTDGVGCGG